MLETFAAQAVIAIENVRLFKELQERNAELREALEHQTATAEVLGIISRSPTDVQPVLDAIVESAAQVCGIDDVVLRLRDGDLMVARAHFGPIPMPRNEVSIDAPEYRWAREQGTLHIGDLREQRNDFPGLGSIIGFLTFLAAPLRQQGELIGSLNARRIEVRPFTPIQIKLLETFADQAVIAIENVRLFNELKESLEQQTATSEILGVIASSPTDIQPVLNTWSPKMPRGSVRQTTLLIRLALTEMCCDWWRIMAQSSGFRYSNYRSRATRSAAELSLSGKRFTFMTSTAEAANEFPDSKSQSSVWAGARYLAVPLLREGVPIGVIIIRRQEVRPFSEKQIALLETFAAQAVIAIENVRLFKESRSATQNCARRWSIRRRRPRCSASSAARRRTCSRCSTPSSRARRGFVGSMTWCCDFARATSRFRGLILVPFRLARVEVSIDEPRIRWMREHGTLHIPDVRERRTNSQA